MLGRGKALAKKQAELEKQVNGLKNALSLVSQENRVALEGTSREFRTEIRGVQDSLAALDGSVKAQMAAVGEVTSAIGKSTNLEAINLLEMMQTFSERLAHVEDIVNHAPPTTIIEQAEVFNAPVEIPATAAPDVVTKAPRAKGRRRRKNGGDYTPSTSDPPVEA